MQRLNQNAIHFNTIQASNMTVVFLVQLLRKIKIQADIGVRGPTQANMDNNSVETTVMSVGISGYAFIGN